MSRAATFAAAALAAVLAAAPAGAEFRLRLPSRHGGAADRAPGGRSGGAVRLARGLPQFPEGRVVSSFVSPDGASSFALYSCGLQPDEALAAASAALAAAGWTRVFSTASLALFENASGRCAAVQVEPAQDAATAVAFIVRL